MTVDWYSIATLAAIVLGPLTAVFATRFLDIRLDARRRKYEVFRNLMQTRGLPLDPMHVAALNVVEIEYYGDHSVVAAYNEYINHLNAPMPIPEERQRFFSHRADLFYKLLARMGSTIGLNFDKRDLEALSYVPQGWGSDQDLQRTNAQLLRQVLSGEKPIPITNHISASGPFPAPPSIEQQKDPRRS